MSVRPQGSKRHLNRGAAEVVVSFGSLWCNSLDMKLDINKRVRDMRTPLAARGEPAGSKTGHQMYYMFLNIKQKIPNPCSIHMNRDILTCQ